MKLPKNEKYASIAFYAGAAVVVSVLIIMGIMNFGTVLGYVRSFFAALSPFIYGFVFAYLVSPIMNFYERTVFAFKKARKDRKKLRRALSLILALITVIAVLTVIVYAIVPSIAECFTDIDSKLGIYGANIQKFADTSIRKISNLFFDKKYMTMNEFMNDYDISFSLKDVIDNSYNLMRSAFDYIVNYGGKILNEVINILVGIFVAIYFLAGKEKLCAQIKKLLSAVFSRRAYLNTIRLARYTHKTFGGFIVGKIIDSFIIGFLSFFIFWIFGIPYYPLLALIIGLTNIIPNFGPIIGGVVGGVFLLIVQPGKVILFVILVLVIQQFDGNVLGPRILGDSIGLSAMWVMLAIIGAGALFGFAGMLVGVPATAVIYALIKQWSERKLTAKNMPKSTAFYLNDPPIEDSVDSGYVFIAKNTDIPEISAENDVPELQKAPKPSITERIKKIFNKKKVKK